MSNIIHRGSLTLEKLKELCYEHLDLKSDSDEYNPHLNANVISLIRQQDGNYKGYAQKGGTMLEVREIGPETALQALLTHN